MTRVWQRFGAAAAAVAIVSMGALPAAAQVEQIPASVEDPRVLRTSFYLPVRDGTRIAVNVYRPAQAGRAIDGRFPVVFAFTPYRARYRSEGKLIELIDSPVFGLRKLVHAGYVVATADVRGKGASFGARRGFLDQTEAHDGYDIIQWLARQPYTSGTVGMTGCSYLGGSAMLVAGTRPPALRAVFAAATDLDKYAFVRNGGITAQFNTRPDEPLSVDAASEPVDGGASLLPQAVAEHARNTPMAALWAGMPYRDSVSPLTGTRFWEEVGPYTHLPALKRPGLAWYLWSNWNDEPTEQILKAGANLDAKVIIGPGSHCEPTAAFDVAGEQKRFFDHYLKGIDNGIAQEPRFAWWRQDASGGGRMERSNTAPWAETKRHTLFLAAARNGEPGTGALGRAKAQNGRTAFTVNYDLNNKDYFSFWPPVQDKQGATFTSGQLATEAMFEGYPVLHLRVGASGPRANAFAYLEDVAPNGDATMVGFGRLALSHRKLGRAPYENLGLPYHSGLRADVSDAVPGKIYTLDFALSPRSYTFAAGHRIRVRVTGADPRQRNLAEIKGGLAKTITLATDAQSRIEIPFKQPPAFR